MDFLLFTIGSHGDVHPFVGVGRALLSRGHSVRVAANELYEPMIRKAGLGFVQMGSAEQFNRWSQDPDIWHPTRGGKVVFRGITESLREVYDTAVREVKPGTHVAASSLCLGVLIASETQGFPISTLHLSPLCVRSIHRMPRLPAPVDLNWLPMWMRKQFWAGADRWFIEPMIAPGVNALRQELNLQSVSGIIDTYWHSPRLTLGLWPDWFFPHQPDYPKQLRLTGFPLYDESNQAGLSPDLERWLAAGSAPIAFTPGSAMRFGQKFFATAADACRRMKRRGILLTRHADQIPPNLPDDVRYEPFVPFGALLPRCSAIVHHGGIGTTAQALHCGVPQLVMPMSHDQFDNAANCRLLGVGDWVGQRWFTPRRVGAKLNALIDRAEVRRQCDEIARKSQAHDGLEMTCQLLESQV